MGCMCGEGEKEIGPTGPKIACLWASLRPSWGECVAERRSRSVIPGPSSLEEGKSGPQIAPRLRRPRGRPPQKVPEGGQKWSYRMGGVTKS